MAKKNINKRPRVLNVLIAGHAQHGKSSLIEAMVGQFPDNLDFELSHGTTVSLKIVQFHLKKHNLLINFLDSPGHADFKGGIALGLEIADLLVLVISGKEGFQARTYWLHDVATNSNIPMIIAATKMDLPFASIDKIKKELANKKRTQISIVETSAKKEIGILDLIDKISIQVKRRGRADSSDLEFVILGYHDKKGIGEMLNIGILSGSLKTNQWLTEKIKIRHVFSLKKASLREATEGDIVQIALNISSKFALGTKYRKGKFISPKIEGQLSTIQPRKEFHISVEDPTQFKIALDVLESIKKVIPSFNYYIDQKSNTINLLVLGDLQFDFIKERLEDLMEFKIMASKIKGIVTINKPSKGHHKSARVRITPRCRKMLSVSRINEQEKTLNDILGATTALEAFHLDGLHVEIHSGKNEDDVAQAIAKAIEKVKIIKMVPHQDVIVKVDNYHDLFSLIDRYKIEVLHQSQVNSFFLQVKNQEFEEFFNALMKISEGKAEINLFKFDQDDVILSVDPGTRHYGFSLIERAELPRLWYVNLKKNIEDQRTQKNAEHHLINELDTFLGSSKDEVSKIFIGNGPGSQFIIDVLINYFNIPCEDYSCVISDLNQSNDSINEQNDTKRSRFEPPDIFLVDEFKTTKEALFHLQQGKLVSQVESKGFVDHAIAALLIAKRGIKGETLKIEKKPLTQLHDYIIENYAGSYSFSTIHNVNSIHDIKPGMYLRVKDSSLIDASSLSNNDIISFIGFGTDHGSIHASTLTGSRIIVKFSGNVKIKRDFFKILVPVKERT